MNISQAKEELIHTVKTYMAKDEQGQYLIPRLRQRPVLLMGPPGIGKTAIMEQVARECEVGLVAYTMTHHTRQSAIGLPVVQKRVYGGQEYTVTEYTMSEIVASVYSLMERTGCKEGILFLDEINCVSETLAPVMLQFLQNKTFGNHRLPDGWMIAAAGNPKEYNKAARDFDIATLDRVRRMEISPDFESWKQYALFAGIHTDIISYLMCRPDSFYHIHQTMEGLEFVTARGWEDLSVIMQEYERQGFSIEEELVREFISCNEIVRDFYSFYKSQEYLRLHHVNKNIDNTRDDMELEAIARSYRKVEKDVAFSITSWLLTGIYDILNKTERENRCWKRKKELVENFWNYSKTVKDRSIFEIMEDYIQRNTKALRIKEENGLLEDWKLFEEREVLDSFKEYKIDMMKNNIKGIEGMKELFLVDSLSQKKKLDLKKSDVAKRVRKLVIFLKEAFGMNEEMLSFMTGIYKHPLMKEIEQLEISKEYRKCLQWLDIHFAEKKLEEYLGYKTK